MTPSKILFWWSVSFIVGVFVASVIAIPRWLIVELFLLGIFYSLLFWREKAIAVFGICLLVFGVGIWRTTFSAVPPRFAPVAQTEAGPLSAWREKLEQVVNKNLSPPNSTILSGILFGSQGEISSEWKKKMNVTSTRHITAVSGMNIVMLAEILVWLGIFLGFYRHQAVTMAAVLVWFYIIFIGCPSSAVRAGIMGSLLLLAQALGRQNVGARTIFLAAAVMLAINPLALKNDWGFQLSFLATLGLVYLMPFWQGWLDKVPGLKKSKLSELLAMTLSAQVFTLPLLVFNFGYISFIGLVANILIVPFVPLIMILGFVLVILGSWWSVLGLVSSWPCYLLMSYLTLVIDWCSRVPLASIQLHFSWIFMALGYVALGVWVWYLKSNLQRW